MSKEMYTQNCVDCDSENVIEIYGSIYKWNKEKQEWILLRSDDEVIYCGDCGEINANVLDYAVNVKETETE